MLHVEKQGLAEPKVGDCYATLFSFEQMFQNNFENMMMSIFGYNIKKSLNKPYLV